MLEDALEAYRHLDEATIAESENITQVAAEPPSTYFLTPKREAKILSPSRSPWNLSGYF